MLEGFSKSEDPFMGRHGMPTQFDRHPDENKRKAFRNQLLAEAAPAAGMQSLKDKWSLHTKRFSAWIKQRFRTAGKLTPSQPQRCDTCTCSACMDHNWRIAEIVRALSAMVMTLDRIAAATDTIATAATATALRVPITQNKNEDKPCQNSQ